jgi:hypothetical protein
MSGEPNTPAEGDAVQRAEHLLAGDAADTPVAPATEPVDVRMDEASPDRGHLAEEPVHGGVAASESDVGPVAEEPGVPRSLLALLPVQADLPPAWDAADAKLGVTIVPYRDIAALLVDPRSEAGDADPAHLTARHWEVHRALLRGTVAPAPLGIVFESDREVVRFLTEAYATIKGALSRVEGRWEFRLHVDLGEAGLSESLALDLVTHIYAELRRISHAAIPFPREGKRLLSAALLVERGSTSPFQDRVEELARVNSALMLDLTGPWPPYDFVHVKV